MATRARSYDLKREPDPWLETLGWLLDRSIPIGPWRIGLDPLIGLIPGFGDWAGALLSSVIIGRAASLGIPRAAVARMLVNALVDTLVGAIPFFGDAFDFGFQANTRNLRILRESLAGPRRSGRDWGFVILVLAGILVLLAVPLILLAWAVRALW